jgi:hypothetical protein
MPWTEREVTLSIPRLTKMIMIPRRRVKRREEEERTSIISKLMPKMMKKLIR